MAERWEEIEARLTDRWLGHSDPTQLALIDACKRIAELEAERDRVAGLVRSLDCRHTGRGFADMSGSHCPTDKPCQRCDLERERDEARDLYREAEERHANAVAKLDQAEEVIRTQADIISGKTFYDVAAVARKEEREAIVAELRKHYAKDALCVKLIERREEEGSDGS